MDGKTSRGARRAGGTRVHLLGVAEHGGRLLDHLEIDVKHNETSHFTELLQPLDLAGAVVTFDALHTVRANLRWLAGEKKGHYIAVVKKNQPLLYARVKALPWQQVPAGSLTRDTGHGRTETRTLKSAHVKGLDFPFARQAIKITRWRQDTTTGKISRQTVLDRDEHMRPDASMQSLGSLRPAFEQLGDFAGFDAVADLWGGGVVMDATQRSGKRPVAPIDYTKDLRAPLLGIFGNDDKSPSPEQVDQHEAELKKQGKTYEFHRYDGAGHGFFYYHRPSYRAEQATDGWEKVLAFFAEHLDAEER